MANPGPSAADTPDILRLYDRLGGFYDWFMLFEARSKRRAMQLLAPAPGQRLLNVGCGTGLEHRHLTRAVSPGGQAHGLDASLVMAKLAARRSASPLLQADARWLPYAPESFDSLICTYVLDLLPAQDLPAVLGCFWRVLRPAGSLVLLSLTEGCTPASRLLVSAWKLAYRFSPLVCGGCRPLQLAHLAEELGFRVCQREVIVQMGVPSELILAEKAG